MVYPWCRTSIGLLSRDSPKFSNFFGENLDSNICVRFSDRNGGKLSLLIWCMHLKYYIKILLFFNIYIIMLLCLKLENNCVLGDKFHHDIRSQQVERTSPEEKNLLCLVVEDASFLVFVINRVESGLQRYLIL